MKSYQLAKLGSPVVRRWYWYIDMVAHRSSDIVGFGATLANSRTDWDLVESQYG